MQNEPTPNISKPESRQMRATNLALLMGSSLLPLILAEILLRIFGFQFTLVPEIRMPGKDFPGVIHNYQRDGELLWVPENYRAKLVQQKGERPALLFMGDSCTELGAYPQNFAELFERKHPDVPLRMARLGSVGYSSFQGQRQFARDGIPLQPAVATFYYGWNDHWKGFGIEDRQMPGVLTLMSFGLDRSRLVQLIARAFLIYNRGDRDPTQPVRRVQLADYRKNLTRIVESARAANIEAVLITAPSSHIRGREPHYLGVIHLDDIKELVPLHQAYLEVVREVAADTGSHLCDLAQTFDRLPAERRTALFWEDGIHLRPAGDRYFARALYECMESRGLVTKVEKRLRE